MDAEAKARFNALMGMTEKRRSVRAPFGWPGSKARSVAKLLELVPYGSAYGEPFGGSAALLLERQPSGFEIYNDRFGGITCFFKALRDHPDDFKARIEATIFSREEWELCHEEWEDQTDTVERAAQWFYMTAYSFSQLGRHWGRSLKGNGNPAGKIKTRLSDFRLVSDRLQGVVIENNCWQDILADYDQPGMVWYLDPPYVQTPPGTYKHNLSEADHEELIATVKQLKGISCISGYRHPIYDSKPWTSVHEWDIRNRMSPLVSDNNNKSEDHLVRGLNTEVLWIWDPKKGANA